MSTTQSAKEYRLHDAYILMNDDKYDITGMIAEFQWYETIDSPFIRCDITMLDTIQFGDNLFGDEMLKLCFETYAAVKPENRGTRDPEREIIDHDLQIYKIGSVSKMERKKAYILHCASPEVYLNEANRTFGGYGPYAQKAEVVKDVIVNKLKAPQKIKHDEAIESHSNINFVSPNWRPVDCISYLTDKVVRKEPKGGTGGKKISQSGFFFYENRFGFNFHSIDKLCEQDSIETYTYMQANVEGKTTGDSAYRIESIVYPERMNHLDKMRSGLYKSISYGLVVPALSESAVPNTSATSSGLFDRLGEIYNNTTEIVGDAITAVNEGEFSDYLADARTQINFFNSGGEANRSFSMDINANLLNWKNTQTQINTAENQTKPGGTKLPPAITFFGKVFQIASTLEEGFPYDKKKIALYEEDHPTRIKVKVLPKYTQQTNNQTNNGADNAPEDILAVMNYASARVALLNTLSLTITVPGNTALYAGGVITCVIPSSKQTEGTNTVEGDEKYSGKYLIKGLKHSYNKEGMQTQLVLCRDSVPNT